MYFVHEFFNGHITRSHSIRILNVQIDTKSFQFVTHHQFNFNNIKLSLFATYMKWTFPWMLYDYKILWTIEEQFSTETKIQLTSKKISKKGL